MSVLRPTKHYGTVTFLGRVTEKPKVLASHPVPQLHAYFHGVEGEVHAGLTRPRARA